MTLGGCGQQWYEDLYFKRTLKWEPEPSGAPRGRVNDLKIDGSYIEELGIDRKWGCKDVLVHWTSG